MKIGIDGIAAIGKSGNATYTRELVRALLDGPTGNRYYLYTFLHDLLRASPIGIPAETKVPYKEIHAYLAEAYFRVPKREQLSELLVRLRSMRNGVDVFHFTNPLNFSKVNMPSVVTIHDLSPLYPAQWTKEHSRERFSAMLGTIAEEASAFIAVSEFTKKDMVEKMNIAPERITRVYEAASMNFFPDTDPNFVKQKYGVGTFILYAGQLQPRKNILSLIRAWSKACKNISDTSLILVGAMRDAEFGEQIKDCIRAEGVADSVILAGTVDYVSLRKLYSTARCFVYPSYFEGFGLPVLEALACGTPVITSTTSSLPEVAGDAAILVGPDDVSGLQHAIEKLCCDNELYRNLKSKAVPHATTFSWKNAALETLEVYKKLTQYT